MARKAREKSISNIYHIMMRGINHQNIFDDTNDFFRFEGILMELTRPSQKDVNNPSITACEIYAYVFMNNHFHLLLKPIDLTVGEVVKSLACAYVGYYNKRNNRIGHLFQDRYKSEPVEDDEYFITLLRYIHQNPVKAHMVAKPELYLFSSWNEYLGTSRTRICNTNVALGKISLEELKALTNESVNNKMIGLLHRRAQGSGSDRKIIEAIQAVGCQLEDKLKTLSKADRKVLLTGLLRRGAGVCQLSKLTGINKMTIFRLKKKLENESSPLQNVTKGDSPLS